MRWGVQDMANSISSNSILGMHIKKPLNKMVEVISTQVSLHWYWDVMWKAIKLATFYSSSAHPSEDWKNKSEREKWGYSVPNKLSGLADKMFVPPTLWAVVFHYKKLLPSTGWVCISLFFCSYWHSFFHPWTRTDGQQIPNLIKHQCLDMSWFILTEDHWYLFENQAETEW